MEHTTKQSGVLEKSGIFDENMKKRYELTIEYKGKKGKNILVLCLNPASANIQISDTTTNFLMNNLFAMGYTTITVCNLFATICPKLNASVISDNSDNLEYIKEVLSREFQTILIGYGNTFVGNKKVEAEKMKVDHLLLETKKKAMELVDKDEVYSRLKIIHPLFAGQRFSGNWKFRKHIIEEEITEKEEK